MRNIKLNVAKSLVLIALFCPAAFADGEQGSGGFADTSSCSTTGEYSSLDGEQGSGGRGLTESPCEEVEPATTDSVFTSIMDYFDWMI